MRCFPSPKSEKRIREKTRNLTNNRARSIKEPVDAKEMGNNFAHSPASNVEIGKDVIKKLNLEEIV